MTDVFLWALLRALADAPGTVQDAVQNMLQLFASDFEELGYSVDPLQKAPERRAPCWMRA